MALTEFLTSLQRVKKELLRSERASFSERTLSSRKMQELIFRDRALLMDLDPYSPLFSDEFYNQQIIGPAAQIFLKIADPLSRNAEAESSAFPTGVIAVGLKSPFFLRLLCERLAPGLAAGNVFLIKPHQGQEILAKHVVSLLVEAGFAQDSCVVLPVSDEITPFLFQHPGIRAVSWFDPEFSPELLGGAQNLIEKKWQIHRGGKSTALVLADADLDQAAIGIVRSIYEGWGTGSWNVSRILVLDSIQKEFTQKLMQVAQQFSFDSISTKVTNPNSSARSNLEKKKAFWLPKLQAEQGRLLDSNMAISFLENVSNCTEAHQIELGSPIVFVMSVKYAHEMQKWVNNLSNSMCVQIWAGDEKAQKMAAKLEAARIWIRCWVEADLKLSYGVKSSIFGTCQDNAFGEFYSERRQIDSALPS